VTFSLKQIGSFLRKAVIPLNLHRVGIQPATVEVRFEHLTVAAKVFTGDRSMPTVGNAYRDVFEVRKEKERFRPLIAELSICPRLTHR
jgi:ABC-transporter N-terminal